MRNDAAGRSLARALIARADALAVVLGVLCVVLAVFLVDVVAGIAALGIGLIFLGAAGSRHSPRPTGGVNDA